MTDTPAEPTTQVEGRPPLTRERVLRAGIALADEAGIDGLSMRRLGQVLGVEAMSLYNHVANKDDLLDGMVELVVAEFEPPAAGPDWRAEVRRSSRSAYDALLRHRWACPLLVTRGNPSPPQLAYSDAVLGCLRAAGFSVELAHYAFHALDSHVVGFTLWQMSFPFKNQAELVDLGRRFLAQLPAADYPHLTEHIRYHLEPASAEGQSAFDFGLELVLDSLERLRAVAASAK